MGRGRRCHAGSNRRKAGNAPSAATELVVGEAGDGFRTGAGIDRGSAPTQRHAHARGTPHEAPHPTDPGLYRDDPALGPATDPRRPAGWTPHRNSPSQVAGAVGPGLLTPAGYPPIIRRRPPDCQVPSLVTMSQQRVITYIDGYNLYYGLLQAGLGSSRWLDLPKLATSLLKPGQQLTLTRYFTTRVKGDPAKARRQALYVDALTTRGGIEIDFGHFLSKRVTCHSCGHHWTKSTWDRSPPTFTLIRP